MALTDAQITTLSDKITNDPDSLGTAGKSNGQLKLLFNDSTVGSFTKKIVLDMGSAIKAMAVAKVIGKLQTEAALTTNSRYNEAYAAVQMLSVGGALLDLNDVKISAMLSSLVEGGVLTAEDRTNFEAEATVAATPGEQYFGRDVVISIEDIRKAVS